VRKNVFQPRTSTAHSLQQPGYTDRPRQPYSTAVQSSVWSLPLAVSGGGTNPAVTRSVVERIIRSSNRKRYNIIVSGLFDPSNDQTDKTSFVAICRDILDIDPVVTKTYRIKMK